MKSFSCTFIAVLGIVAVSFCTCQEDDDVASELRILRKVTTDLVNDMKQVEEALHQSNKALHRADKAHRQAEEAHRQADIAHRQAENDLRQEIHEMRLGQHQLQTEIDAYQDEADEAHHQADEAHHQLEEAHRQAEETCHQADKTHRQAENELRQEMHEMRLGQHQLQTEIDACQDASAGLVAFRVKLSGSITSDPSDDKTIPWDRVITNIGGGFEPTSQQFFAPVSGIYYMAFSVYMNHADPTYIRMMHNDQLVSTAYTSDADMLTKTEIVQLAAGDTVYIAMLAGTGSIYDAADDYCSFSGFLIHETI